MRTLFAQHCTQNRDVISGTITRFTKGRENLAGAVGFEPTPSALTVRCPTGWTTPQQFQNVQLIFT